MMLIGLIMILILKFIFKEGDKGKLLHIVFMYKQDLM